MSLTSRLCIVALGLPLVLAAPAMAQAPMGVASDAPVASARDAAIDAQIADYLNAATAPLPSQSGDAALSGPVDAPAQRQVHGEVGVGIGTGGYREAYASMIAPVGKSGTVAVAVADQRGRGWFGPVHNQSLSVAVALGEGNNGAAPPVIGCDDRATGRGFEPLWASRMRADHPAADLNCTGSRFRR